MPTRCSQEELDFGSSGGRKLVGAFDGGAITSNGGAGLLGAADRAIRLAEPLAGAFHGLPGAAARTHTGADLLPQRIFGLAPGQQVLSDPEARRHLLAAKLRSSSVDAADGSVEEVARILAQIRVRWPTTSIVIRADSGFCRDDLMSWCEANNVQYVLGLAGNSRLKAWLAPEMRKAKRKSKRTGKPAREFADFAYRTRKSWSCKRRVIGKAEWTKGEANPRFIVTNIHAAFGAGRFLSESVYCHRGEMENRLKECQGELFADRTPAPTMRANQLRLWLSSFAYILMCAVRRIGLAGTKLESATCGTIRLALLKIGALVTISVRRVKLAFASACPAREVFTLAQRRL